jgi:filamentous hemagglutinin
VLYAAGHSDEQKPIIEGRKNPDFLIDGEVFDNYAPITTSVRNIRTNILDKLLQNQSKSFVLNLRDTSVSKKEIEQILIEYPIEGLNRLWVVDKYGELHYLIGGKRNP